MEEEKLFNKDDALKHLADLILGKSCPSCEADRKFLENLSKACKEKEDEKNANKKA